MARYPHPCLCRFRPETYSQVKQHAPKCLIWRNRADPRGLSIRRRAFVQKKYAKEPPPCPYCQTVTGEHHFRCPHEAEDARVRRELVDRHDINPEAFRILLEALAKRYEGKTVPFIETPR